MAGQDHHERSWTGDSAYDSGDSSSVSLKSEQGSQASYGMREGQLRIIEARVAVRIEAGRSHSQLPGPARQSRLTSVSTLRKDRRHVSLRWATQISETSAFALNGSSLMTSTSHSASLPKPTVLPHPSPVASERPHAYTRYLGMKSRLRDYAFFETSACHARIPHPRQMYFLDEGLRLAKASMARASKEYMPVVHNATWSEGGSMVEFGMEGMSGSVLGGGLPDMKSAAINVETARDAIHKMPALRNAACHPGGDIRHQQLKRLDEYLELGQRVAVEFHDYDYAMGVRALRDQLQREGEQSYLEIVSPVEPQTTATSWARHHETNFQEIIKFPFGIPAKIRRAAEIWNKGGNPRRLWLLRGGLRPCPWAG